MPLVTELLRLTANDIDPFNTYLCPTRIEDPAWSCFVLDPVPGLYLPVSFLYFRAT